MPRSGYVLFLSLLLTAQCLAQSKNDFAEIVLAPSSGLSVGSQAALSDQPIVNTAREVELWVGSSPVSVSTDAETLPLPSVVSNVPGRLVFRDQWGSVIPLEPGVRPRILSRSLSASGSPLRLKSSLASGSIKLEADGLWKKSTPRLQWSDDLETWRDYPGSSSILTNLSLPLENGMSGRFFRAVIPAPEPPTILLTKASENRIKLVWKGSGEAFRIEFSTNSPSATSAEDVSYETDLSSPAVIRNLQPATTYYFRIQAIGPGGVSAWSPIVESTTQVSPMKSGQRRLLIFGSSVASGTGDPTGKGWAGRLKDSLGTNWVVINRSIPGDSTKSLLDRFDRDVVGESWDVIWVALSLMNEGIFGPNPDSTYETYVLNQRKLIGLIRQLGAVPVVSSAYPNSLYGPRELGYCRRFNAQLNDWGVAGIDFWGALDDGTGKWIPGHISDALHPNATGHEAMFRSIPHGLLDSLVSPEVTPAETFTAIKFTDTATNSAPICFIPNKSAKDFTLSFWFSGTNLSNKALCGIGPGASRIRAPGGWLRYTSFNGAEVLADSSQHSDGNWHHVSLVHQAGLSRTTFYLDGERVGAISEQFASIEKFTLGGRADDNPWANATGVAFWGFSIHRVPLSPEIVASISAGKNWKLSTDLSAPISLLPSIPSPTATKYPSIRGRIEFAPGTWAFKASYPSLFP